MKEEWKAISLVSEKVNYKGHQWLAHVNCKMVNFHLNQQIYKNKYPCFLFFSDSRAKSEHYTKKELAFQGRYGD